MKTLTNAGIDLRAILNTIENNYIEKALQLADNNVSEAARLLKLNRTTLVEKMRNRRTGRRGHSEEYAHLDPEGEFTFRKTANGKGFDVLYLGEKLHWCRTLEEVQDYIKEKIDE